MSSYIYSPLISESEHVLSFEIFRHDRCVNIESTMKLDRKIINSVLESLIFNIVLIIHTRISEIHMFKLCQ